MGMKTYMLRIACLLIALLPVMAGCAEKPATAGLDLQASPVVFHVSDARGVQTYLLGNDDVVVWREGQISLFFNGAISQEALIKKMLWLLKATHADKAFVEVAPSMLARNRRTAKEQFKLTLTDIDGMRHEFILSNSGFNQLSILNYKRSPDS